VVRQGVESRSLDRLIAFTDAAVAIALTLLALPLVEIAHDAAGEPLGTIVRTYRGDVFAFVISFFVVMLFWRVHRRLFEPLRTMDDGLLTINGLWLLGVVFLPVPTAVLTFGADGGGDATFYLGNLLFVALAGVGLSGWVRLRPQLCRPELHGMVRGQLLRGLSVSGVVALATVLSLWWGTNALLLLLVLPVVRRMAFRRRDRAAY
jgi:uncharacterized membrane protein